MIRLPRRPESASGKAAGGAPAGPSGDATRPAGFVDRLLGLDVLLCLALLGTVALVRLRSPIGNPELGSHLAAGARMLGDLALPDADPFSYMAGSERWIVDTWLADVLLAAVRQMVGPHGLIIAAATLIGLTFAVTQHACRAVGARPTVAFVVTLIAGLSSASTWFVGPDLLAFFCMAIFIHVLAVDRHHAHARPDSTATRHPHLWLLFPTLILWENTHPTFVLGIALIAIDVVARWRVWVWNPGAGGLRLRRCTVLVCLVGALVLNPYGLALPLHVAALAVGALGYGGTYTHGLHTFEGQVVMALLFWVLLTMAMSPGRKEPMELGSAVPLAVIAYAAPPMAPFFAMAAAVVLARHVDALLPAHIDVPAALSTARRGVHTVALGTCSVLFALGFKGTPASPTGQALSPAQHPAEAVAFLKAQPALGRLFNYADWGGYLIDNLYPHYQVSMDARQGLYTGANQRAYEETERAGPQWREFFDACAPDVVLWRRHDPLVDEVESLPEWGRLYEDDVAVILVRENAVAMRPRVGEAIGIPPRHRVPDLGDDSRVEEQLGSVRTHRKRHNS